LFFIIAGKPELTTSLQITMIMGPLKQQETVLSA
jgi:hypothetical protein